VYEIESCASQQDQGPLPRGDAGREPMTGWFGWASSRRRLCLGDKELFLHARAGALATALTPWVLHAPGPARGAGLTMATLEVRTPWPLGTGPVSECWSPVALG